MPDEFKDLLAQLRDEVHKLRDTWRRLLIVAVVGVLAVILTLAGLGAYFIVTTRQATDRANQAISDVGHQADSQAQALRCIENYENAVRHRTIVLTSVGKKRTDALDDEIHALNRVLRAALRHEPQRKVLRLAERWRRLSVRYDHASRVYRTALREHPVPRLRKFRCAERVARHTPQPTPNPAPTATVTRTEAAPGPTVTRTVTLPGPTITRTVVRTRTVYAPPGQAHKHRSNR